MAVAKLKKVGILGYLGKMDDIVTGLQDLGMVHLIRERVPDELFGQEEDQAESQFEASLEPLGVNMEQSASTSDASKMLSSIQQIIELLMKFHPLNEDGIDNNTNDIDTFAADYDIDSIIKRVLELNSKIDNDERELRIAERKIIEVKPFLDLDIVPSELSDFQDISAFIGQVPLGQYHEMQKNMDESLNLYELDKVNDHYGNVYFIGYCHNSIRDDFEDYLRQHEFLPLDIEVRGNTPKIVLEQQNKIIGLIKSEIVEAKNTLEKLAQDELPSMILMAEYYESLVQREQVIGAAQKSSKVFYMTGWVRHELYTDLENKMQGNFPETDIFELETRKDEDAPVALTNPKWLQPFEILTNMYGRPKKGMIDPTPWTGPFFALFFAFCMTDAGYGLLLALVGAGGLIFKGKKLSHATKNFMMLIVYLGVLTIGAGAIAGSYFGFNPSLVENPGAFTSFLLKLKLFDPLDDALLFFALTVYFAMVQLAIGFGISAYVKMKQAANAMLKTKEFVLGLSWILLSIGLSILVTQYIYKPWADPFSFLMPGIIWFGMGGVVLGFAIFGPLGGEKIVSSIFNAIGFDGLYGITGLFGDILSYARILALGISTGVIGGVINNLGGILAGGSIILGIVAAIVVAASHVGYTALSALSAFIHPLRLQYVEYFGKFYETGGTDFKPFKKNYKNVK